MTGRSLVPFVTRTWFAVDRIRTEISKGESYPPPGVDTYSAPYLQHALDALFTAKLDNSDGQGFDEETSEIVSFEGWLLSVAPPPTYRGPEEIMKVLQGRWEPHEPKCEGGQRTRPA